MDGESEVVRFRENEAITVTDQITNCEDPILCSLILTKICIISYNSIKMFKI
jgi:hypothetical protein